MAYPNPTTYTLVFGEKIRVSSRCRFVLVRSRGDLKPVIVKRSDKFVTIYNAYNTQGQGYTDYIIDQLQGTVMIPFNGRHEVHDAFGKRVFELNTIAYGSPVAQIEAALVRPEDQS
jgi:hypothetical protein